MYSPNSAFEHCLSTLQWCPLTLSALKIDKSRKYFPINGFQTMNAGILIQLAWRVPQMGGNDNGNELICVMQCFWTTAHDPVDKIRCRTWDQRHWILSLQASATVHNKQLQLNKEAVGWVVEDEDWGLKCHSRRTNADTFGKPGTAWSRAQASNISTLKEGPKFMEKYFQIWKQAMWVEHRMDHQKKVTY